MGRAVITGIGVVSPNGMGCARFSEALRRGESGVKRLPFESTMIQTKHAGCVEGFDPLEHVSVQDARRTPRTVHLATAAAKEALRTADLAPEQLGTSMGCLLGSGGGGLAFVEAQYKLYFTGQKGYSPFTITSGTHGNLSSELSIAFGLRGPSHCISTGCTSSTDAIGYAMMQIAAGVCPMFLAGGSDAPIAEGILRGFELMRILAANTDPPANMSRPFSKDRDGFVLGEGAWMFVVEDADHAAARKATVYAELLGYASTCDAFHRVQPSPDGVESARAVTEALRMAGVKRDELDYVNLHGTSTQMNDALETLALHKALGEGARRTPMSATKSMIGHPQGASGAAGLAATILSLREGFVHPTVNLREADPACDLDYVANEARVLGPSRSRIALCNCIAFGSKNSALVVRVPGA